jgi:lambda family phage tail tape measure protein
MAGKNTLETAVKVTGLEQLQTLQSRIEGVSDKFSNLSSAIAGFALVNVVKNILGFADAVSDLSDATGVAIEDVLGFQKAVTAFGGTADGADKALLKLTQTLGEARSGNDQAKEAFMKLGFTLNDIATLEGKGLLIKTLEGLGNISDKAQQAALKAQLLTKDFRVVAIEGDNVANSFKTLSGQSVGSAAAIKNVADANQNLEKVFGDLKIAIAKVVSESGLADWIKAVSLNSQELEKYVKIAGIAFVTYFGAQTIVNLIKIGESIMVVAKAVVALEVATSTAGGKVATLVSLLAKIGLAAALVTQASELNLGEDEQLEKIKRVENALKELSTEQRATFFALNADQQKQISNLIQLGKTAADAMKSVVKPATGGAPASGGGSGGGKPPESEATKSLKKNIEETVNAYERLNAQRIASIKVQENSVGKTSDEAEMIKTLAEVSAKAREEIAKLNVKKASLTELQLAEGVGGIIENQIKKIEAQEQADLKKTQTAVQGLQTVKLLEENRLQNIENINKAIEDQIKRSETLGDVLKSANDKLVDVNFESSITGLSAVEQQIATINENNRKQAVEAGRAFAAQFEGMDLTTSQSKELADGLEEIAKKYKQISTVQIKAASEARTFGAGWKKALNEYVDNASNAAKRAESLFSKAFGGMEDLLVNFAKTGKFEWKGFVASMLEELLRSQIQMIFAQMMGGMKDSMGGLGGLFGGGGGGGGGGQQESGGGIMDAIGSIFGMGGGGQKGASANNPMYVVDVGSGGMGPMQQGGGGGGLFDSIANLFGGGPEQLAGPGTPEGGGGFFDSLTSGISDFFGGFSGPEQLGGPEDSGGGIFDSLGSLFDGFFAKGGNIGAGKFGVVGENGPELVGGPASVTPMGGGSNVTFNINAVDAQSFKSMIAADPGFLYGVAMQGAKGIPMRG